jgi:ribosomal protein S12 methylthiotransferase accessory factor
VRLKGFTRGTHRAIPPSETLARNRRHAAALGITRLANVTGLDYLGVPVFMAVRPNARSLSVAQGKGLDADAARASALMEAIEFAHAEEPSLDTCIASYESLRTRARVADPKRLPQQKGRVFRAGDDIAWARGKDIGNGEAVWLPLDLVHLDFTAKARAGESGFLCSSNGLASGNTAEEALCAALCEVIERDATALWRLRGESERAGRRIALSSIEDPDAAALIVHLAERGMRVMLWDVTSDIGVACMLCRLIEAPGNPRSQLGAFYGSGCHPAREIALARAVTEAVQSRLTYIAGSRDDLAAGDYEEPAGQVLLDTVRDLMAEKVPARDFAAVPTARHASFAEDVSWLCAALARAGLDEIVTVDLTRGDVGVPVIRVVVPGLEGVNDHALCKPGARARALAKSAPRAVP